MNLIFLRYQQPHPIYFWFIKTFSPAFVEKANSNIGFWPDSADHCFIYSKTLIQFFFFKKRHSMWIMWGFWQVFHSLCLNFAEIPCRNVMSRLPDGSSRRGVLCKHCAYHRSSTEIVEDCIKLEKTFVFRGKSLERLICGLINKSNLLEMI